MKGASFDGQRIGRFKITGFQCRVTFLKQLCNSFSRDFFFNRLVQLPPGINPGDYVLKVTVEDKVKSRIDEASLPLEIKPAG